MNINSIPRTLRVASLAALALLGNGCYLWQSAAGQLSLMSKRQPISRVIDKASTPPALRTQLEAVRAIRDFASRELKLPDNGSYRSYADVGRPYAVWNVVAAPEFSVQAKRWCYPIVGCVAYRGYFMEKRARKLATELMTQGLDVTVGGVAAYSTLGHFDDPVLNTMVEWNDVELAGIIFHELTHQLLYVPNDSSFNEALATTLAEEGLRRWLEAGGRWTDLAAHAMQQQRYTQVLALMNETLAQLRSLYISGAAPAAMRDGKRAAFARLRAAYSRLRRDWQGSSPFDSWFAQDLNNAHLASIATYFACVPGFQRELEAVNGDLDVFYRRVRDLGKLDQVQRDAILCGSA